MSEDGTFDVLPKKEVINLKKELEKLQKNLGGIKTGHGGKTLREMEIPFIISGKNVRKGMEIKESMMQYDTAAMIAYILGLKQPQSWIGRPVKTVFK